MVVALKELEIRGEIRTTIEYIIRLMQSEDFMNNHIDTAWLDRLLSKQKDLPKNEISNVLPSSLVALCGAAVKGFQQLQKRASDFIEMLRMGQVPSIDTLGLDVDLDLIHNGLKFHIRCLQRGENILALFCNGCEHIINIR